MFGDESLGAENGAVGEVANATAQDGRARQPTLGLDHLVEFGGGNRALARTRAGADAEEGEAIIRLCLVPRGRSFASQDRAKSGLGLMAAGDGFAVTAKAVILGIGDEAGADGIEVDVGGHRLEDLALAFHENGFEALGPEGAVAVVGAIEPDGEALFEQLHELGDVAHHRKLAFAPSLPFGIAGLEPMLENFQTLLLKPGGLWVEDRIAAKQLGV